LSFIIPYNLTVRINSSMAMVICLSALIIGYWSWFTGNSMAKYFCLAWTSAFTGVGVLIATKFGIMPANFWTNNAGQVGVMVQVSLFSFALAHRFNKEKEMRIKAQESSLEHERLARRSKEELLAAEAYAKHKLEQQVSERTLNLQKALTDLEAMNKKLEVMSTTDALTKLYNRRYFETSFATEFKLSSRHKRQLSVILCDIDHFKSINDQYGHQAGDECLQHVAEIFNERITRSGDVAARYGGEEFIILLSETSMHQAKQIAEDMRRSIEALNFEFKGRHIPMTASFGVSTLKSRKTQSADQLITQADTALYQAKHSGRNQVVCWQDEASNEGSNITSIEA
jgi:diguanylate cyclase (GGDEF)-like protein